MSFSPRRPDPFFLLFAVLFALLLPARRASGEACWLYDDTQAYTKLGCEELGIPIPASQTVREKHELWHQCFGDIGTSAGPSFRGQRFIAFHRQIIEEFNLWREPNGIEKVETWDASTNQRLPLPYPACVFGDDRDCDLNGDGDCMDPVDLDVRCTSCVTLPRCFTINADNLTGCPPFGHVNLDQFKNADEIGIASDIPGGWHGSFHGGIASADGDPSTPGIQDCTDANFSSVTTGEPLFWRAHLKLDDLFTAWQARHAVDVVMVVDRSGSMLDPVTGGTKLDKAKEAAKLFGALVRGSTNGVENRFGLVSFSNTATAPLPLTNSTTGISADGTSGPLITQVNAISAGGGTSIGAGIERALCQLCPDADTDGDCQSDDCESAGGNPHKAILLLTDGLENVTPCLDGAAAPCAGEEVFYEGTAPYKSLGHTQVCAVGYGEASALDGDLLTRLTERQGGIYVGAKDSDDLKEFFAKCYGELTDALVGIDPKGVLTPHALVSEPIPYDSCQDSALTFVLGWRDPLPPGEVRLALTSPAGRRIDLGDPAVRRDADSTWDFARLPLPYRGESAGRWTAQIVRPHRSFVNGFTSDSFVEMKEGARLVRREIQRLCSAGCKSALYFEDGSATGGSVYAQALAAETAEGTVGAVTRATSGAELERHLGARRWDLIVFAHQKGDRAEGYDALLQRVLCAEGQASIVTDTRSQVHTAALFKCLGAAHDGTKNLEILFGDGRLADSRQRLRNPGYDVWSYGLLPTGGDAQAYFFIDHQHWMPGARPDVPHVDPAPAGTGHHHGHDPQDLLGTHGGLVRPVAAVVASGRGAGREVSWFVNVLPRGSSRLEPHKPFSRYTTGSALKPTVRITQPYRPEGGYDRVVARVEVSRPTRGPGESLTHEHLAPPRETAGDPRDGREMTLAKIAWNPDGDHPHPDRKTFALYDDGTHGDNLPENHYWSVELPPDFARAEGNYGYRFILDLTKNGCTERREVTQTVYVDVGVDAGSTPVGVRPDGQGGFLVDLTPRDRFGQHVGPGRDPAVRCTESNRCKCAAARDGGDGTYTIPVRLAEGAGSCRIEAFGVPFDVVPGRDCRASDRSGCK